MEITVRFTGMMRSLAGLASVHMSLEAGATLRTALLAIIDLVARPFAEQVVQPLVARETVPALLLLNRVYMSDATDLDRRLSPGDVIAFVMPMAGG